MASGRCDQCEVMVINGVRCHEIGCPVEWHEGTRECKECGRGFVPEFRRQTMCNDCEEDSQDDAFHSEMCGNLDDGD